MGSLKSSHQAPNTSLIAASSVWRNDFEPERGARSFFSSKTAIGAFGAIDILMNNAGTGTFAPIEQFSLEDFEKLIAINVRGLFVATQEAARHLREGGRIIHIGSTNSERMP